MNRYLTSFLWMLLLVFVGLLLAAPSAEAVVNREVITLDRAVSLALKNNSSIQNSRRELEKAEADLDASFKEFAPNLDLQSSVTKLDEGPRRIVRFKPTQTGLEPVYEQGSDESYSTSLNLTQPLFMGGEALTGIEIAKKGIKISRLKFNQKKSEIVFQVIQNYFNTLKTKNLVDIRKQSLKVVEEHRKIARANFEAGQALKSDVLQADIEKRRAEQALTQARNDLKAIKERLGHLIGLAQQEFKVEEPGLNLISSLNKEKAYQQALKNRDELKVLEINKEITKLRNEIEGNIHRPNVMLNGNYSWEGDELELNDGSWSATLSVSMPLYDGGKAAEKVKKNKLELETISENRENLQENIRLVIEDNIRRIREVKEKKELESMSLKNARESLEIANKRYKAGIGKNIDVLNAQNELEKAKVNKLQAEYDYKLKLFELLKNTGKILEFYRDVVANVD